MPQNCFQLMRSWSDIGAELVRIWFGAGPKFRVRGPTLKETIIACGSRRLVRHTKRYKHRATEPETIPQGQEHHCDRSQGVWARIVRPLRNQETVYKHAFAYASRAGPCINPIYFSVFY